MKKVLLILGLVWGMLLTATAQQQLPESQDIIDSTAHNNSIDTTHVTLIMDDMTHAVVHQDSAITQLMRDKRIGYVRGEQTMDGFRVQVYASNRQQEAKKESAELQQRIEAVIDVPIYTISEPPFWKVRIGNFATREEANEYKTILLQLFPELTSSTYVVPDKIIVIR